MRRLSVFIEINGTNEYVGEIVGTDSNDACFTYADSYLEKSEASQVGIGSKMAMKRFDVMVNGFVDAINQAKEQLKKQGFDQVEQICDMIMKKGGIRKELYPG